MLSPEAPHVQRWGLSLPHPRLVLKNDEKEEEMASSFLFAKHSFSGPLFLGGASSPLLLIAFCSRSCGHLQEDCSGRSGPCRGPKPCVTSLSHLPLLRCFFFLWGGRRLEPALRRKESETHWSTQGAVLTWRRGAPTTTTEAVALSHGSHPALLTTSSVLINPSLCRGTFAAPPPPLEPQARIGTGARLESA